MTDRPFDLTGRNALITGGSKGLGLSMARALARAGAYVVIAARHADELEAALPTILEGTSARGAWLVADMTRREDVERLAREAAGAIGPIEILVNNAGINRVAPIDEVRDADWDRRPRREPDRPDDPQPGAGRPDEAARAGGGSSTSARSSARSAGPPATPTAPPRPA